MRRQTENIGESKIGEGREETCRGAVFPFLPLQRRPVVASQPAARLGWRRLRYRSQLREPAEENPAAAANACPPEREALLECPPRQPAWALPCSLPPRRLAAPPTPCCSAAGGGGGQFSLCSDASTPPLWCGPDDGLWACVGRSPGRH